MKLERLPEYVTTAVVTLLGILFAIYCGRMTGEGQTRIIMTVGAAAALVFIAIKGVTHIWMFIPATWMFTGQLPWLILPFSIRDVTILSVFATFLVFTALKIVKV